MSKLKLSYRASRPISGTMFPLMGGGMGNKDLDVPLSSMAFPDELNEAIDSARQAIVKEIRKALRNEQHELHSIEYVCEIVNEAESGGVLVEGAYVQVTANVVYKKVT